MNVYIYVLKKHTCTYSVDVCNVCACIDVCDKWVYARNAHCGTVVNKLVLHPFLLQWIQSSLG